MNLISFLEGLRISQSKDDWWDELSDKQRKIVINGLKDADNGKLMSSKEFWKRIKDA